LAKKDTPGEFKFNQTFLAKPDILLSMNGLRVDLSNTTGTIKNKVTYIHNKESINITSIDPMRQEYPVCWLVAPPNIPV